MIGKRISSLKSALNLIIDALDSNDRLSLISFSTKAETLSELKYMNDNEKIRQKGIVDNLIAWGNTYFRDPIRKFLNGIEKSYSPNNGGSNLFFLLLMENHLMELQKVIS